MDFEESCGHQALSMVHKKPTVDDLWSFPPGVTEFPGRRSLRVGERTDPQVCPKARDGCRLPEPLPRS